MFTCCYISQNQAIIHHEIRFSFYNHFLFQSIHPHCNSVVVSLNQGYSAILVDVALLDNLLQAEDVGENSVQISRI